MRSIHSLVTLAALASVGSALATSDPTTPTPYVDCSCWASDTLTDLGISVVADASCIKDGQGCIGTTCRFCRTQDTPEALMYLPCSAVTATTAPTKPATTTAAPSTTTVAPSTTTAAPSTTTTAPSTTTAAPSTTTTAPSTTTTAPSTTTAAPSTTTAAPSTTTAAPSTTTTAPSTTTAAPSTTTSAPTKTTPAPTPASSTPVAQPTPAPSTPSTSVTPTVSAAAPVDGCATWLSTGDKAVGIEVTGDVSCVQGGVGCVGLQCRFCRVRDTKQSHHLLECDAVRGVAASPQASTPPSGSTAPAAADACAKWLSSGDRSVGVGIFSDTGCASGGVGCIADTTCRYCRAKDSAQSKNFVACPASSSASAPSPTTPSGQGTTEMCAKFSTSGDRAVGIQVASDNSCASGGVGCIGNTCRFCRSAKTTQSSHLLACADLPSGSAVVRVDALEAAVTPLIETGASITTGSIMVACAVVAGVVVVVGALVFVLKKNKKMIARKGSGTLAAPMYVEQRTPSLAEI